MSSLITHVPGLLLLLASSPRKAAGAHHLSLGVIGTLSWGPSPLEQLRSLKCSQHEPETAPEKPFRNSYSPSAGEGTVW